MKNEIIPLATVASALFLMLSACGGKKESVSGELPDGFNKLDDASKVAYVMKVSSPDSWRVLYATPLWGSCRM